MQLRHLVWVDRSGRRFRLSMIAVLRGRMIFAKAVHGEQTTSLVVYVQLQC